MMSNLSKTINLSNNRLENIYFYGAKIRFLVGIAILLTHMQLSKEGLAPETDTTDSCRVKSDLQNKYTLLSKLAIKHFTFMRENM